LAQNTVYTVLKNLEEKTKTPAMEVFQKALDNIGPSVELKVKRVAGSNYQVPTEVDPQRRETLQLR
jgi:small subunit ribosomal protein S7